MRSLFFSKSKVVSMKKEGNKKSEMGKWQA
jgi:hypothetical protein